MEAIQRTSRLPMRPDFQLLRVVVTMLILAGCSPLPQEHWGNTFPNLAYPTPPPPTVSASPLMDVVWQVEVILLDGESQDFAETAPVWVIFGTDGRVALGQSQCGTTGYFVSYESTGGSYQTSFEMSAGEECEGERLRHWMLVRDTFEATTQYTQDGDRLTLTGDGVEMRLVRVPE